MYAPLFQVFFPIAQAQTNNFRFFGPLVPSCGEKNVCTVCDIFVLIQNLVNFGLSVMVLIAIVVLAWGGLEILFAAANPRLLESGKKKITRALTGIVIVLVSWLAVDTLIKLLAGQEIVGGAATINGLGPWNEIKCEAPPFPTADSTSGGIGDEGGGNPLDSIEKWADSQPPEGTALKNPSGNLACADTSQYNDSINEAATRYGVSPERIKAIISRESSGNQNAQSTDNDGGSSYGLMQMRLETAKTLDPNATIEKLKNPAYNINLGTKYYAKLLKDNGGNKDLASAVYNGGPAANKPSVNCPGLKRWQCEWDDNAHTLPNSRPGHPGYGITRSYVPAITAIELKYQSGQCS